MFATRQRSLWDIFGRIYGNASHILEVFPYFQGCYAHMGYPILCKQTWDFPIRSLRAWEVPILVMQAWDFTIISLQAWEVLILFPIYGKCSHTWEDFPMYGRASHLLEVLPSLHDCHAHMGVSHVVMQSCEFPILYMRAWEFSIPFVQAAWQFPILYMRQGVCVCVCVSTWLPFQNFVLAPGHG